MGTPLVKVISKLYYLQQVDRSLGKAGWLMLEATELNDSVLKVWKDSRNGAVTMVP